VRSKILGYSQVKVRACGVRQVVNVKLVSVAEVMWFVWNGTESVSRDVHEYAIGWQELKKNCKSRGNAKNDRGALLAWGIADEDETRQRCGQGMVEGGHIGRAIRAWYGKAYHQECPENRRAESVRVLSCVASVEFWFFKL
jgi:hypothetical protein